MFTILHRFSTEAYNTDPLLEYHEIQNTILFSVFNNIFPIQRQDIIQRILRIGKFVLLTEVNWINISWALYDKLHA